MTAMPSGCSRRGIRRPGRCRSTFADNPRWRGLQIVDVVDGRPDQLADVVEFRATYLAGAGEVGVLHERSRFVRENGRWYYLDGRDLSAS